MDQTFHLLSQGMLVALTPRALWWSLFGVVWGTIGGALPGINVTTTLALALPLTFGMAPTDALIMLGAALVGANYGGSIPAILMRMPGTGNAVVTTFDGYPLHLQGKSGVALGVSLISGTIGSFVGILALIAVLVPMANLALNFFHPPELFAFALFGISAASSLTGKNVAKGLVSAALGLAVVTVGLDPLVGSPRFTFDRMELLDGFDMVAALVGLLAVSEVLRSARQFIPWGEMGTRFSSDLPTLAELRGTLRATWIGSVVGVILGIMPGAGGAAATFISYAEARRWSKEPNKFGKGSLEGLAAPEAANNSVVGGDLVPTLALGVPGSTSAAMVMTALIVHGIQPGPRLMQDEPMLVYSLFGGLITASLLMLIIGLVIIRPCVALINLPREMVSSGVMALIIVGIYSTNYSTFDVLVAITFGVLGYWMFRYGYSTAAMALGIVLGGVIERNLRRSVAMSGGQLDIFFTRPLTVLFLILAVLTAVYPWLVGLWGRRKPSARSRVGEGAQNNEDAERTDSSV